MDIRHPLLFLLVFLNMIDLSKGACLNYFNFKDWENNIAVDMVTLAETKNSKDVAECTLHNYCEKNTESTNNICYLLDDCFDNKNRSEKCSPPLEISHNVTIHPYHFMCMVVKAVNQSATAEVSRFCKYETVCWSFAETNSDRTSPPQPTTTLLQTTTAIQPTTTLQQQSTTTLPSEPTTTSPPPTTTLPSEPTTTSPPPTTTLPSEPTTTSPPPTTTLPSEPTTTSTPLTTTTAAAVSTPGPGSMVKQGQNCDVKQGQNCDDILILRLLLSITSVLTVILPLAVYFYMRKQRRLNSMEAAHVFYGISPGAEPVIELQSSTSHANGEITHLIQPMDYPFTTAPSSP